MIWNIPEEGLKDNITTPVISLNGYTFFLIYIKIYIYIYFEFKKKN